MKINFLSRDEFLDYVYTEPQELLERIQTPELFVVKQFYPENEICEWRDKMFDWGVSAEASWHPLKDDCPDYHRLHDNYPQSWVKSRMHGFYNHMWYQENELLFQYFKEIFEMKNFVGGFKKHEFVKNKPSEGLVSRVNFQHYPRGGGYMAEHVDPVGKHAQLQTLIQASYFGKDYFSGGVFARREANSEKVYLDQVTVPGDVMVLSPYIPHGVDPIDPECDYDWKKKTGRWICIPLILTSDYVESAGKPQQVSDRAPV